MPETNDEHRQRRDVSGEREQDRQRVGHAARRRDVRDGKDEVTPQTHGIFLET